MVQSSPCLGGVALPGSMPAVQAALPGTGRAGQVCLPAPWRKGRRSQRPKEWCLSYGTLYGGGQSQAAAAADADAMRQCGAGPAIAPHGMVGPGGGRCAGDGCGITFSDERGDSSPAAASSPTRRSRRWIRLRHSSRPSDSYQPHGSAANFTLLPEAAARVLIRPGAIWAGQTSVVEVKREKRGLSRYEALAIGPSQAPSERFQTRSSVL